MEASWSLPTPPSPTRKNNLEHTYSSSLYAIINCKRHQRRWMTICNLIIAPIVEEIIFRACLLPPLLASSYSSPPSNSKLIFQSSIRFVAAFDDDDDDSYIGVRVESSFFDSRFILFHRSLIVLIPERFDRVFFGIPSNF